MDKVKRYEATISGTNYLTSVVCVADYDALLSVLRQCEIAMLVSKRLIQESEDGTEIYNAVCSALSAVRPYLERKEETPCPK